MPNSLVRRIEREERNLLDRLCWQLRDAQLECKHGMLADDFPGLISPPSLALAAGVGGGLFGSSLLRNPFGAETNEMSRRRFLAKGSLVAGCAVGGLVLVGETQEASAFWGHSILSAAYRLLAPVAVYALKEAFAAVIHWVVPKVCDWAQARVVRYTATDMTAVVSPAPTASKFHNEFAIPLTIAKAKDVEPRKVAWMKSPIGDGALLPIGVKSYLKPYDGGGVGLAQMYIERNADKFPAEALACTHRTPFDNDRYGAEVKKVAASYRLKPGDYSKPKYRDAWIDKKGNEYLSFQVDLGKTSQVLFAKVTKA